MKPSGRKILKLLCWLATGCLLPQMPVRAEEQVVVAKEQVVLRPVLQRQLESLVLPEFRFRDDDFTEGLRHLQMKARISPEKAMQVAFVVNLPADFKPRYELSLDLKTIPFWEALRHLCGQAGVDFTVERGAIAIRPLGSAPAKKTMVRTEIPVPPAAEPVPARGLAGRLGKPAQAFSTGNSVHRATNGEIQPQRSGSVGHRNLSGWAVEDDPGHRLSMNCIDIVKCKKRCCEDEGCGCSICSCHDK